jgi:hypothetical protein
VTVEQRIERKNFTLDRRNNSSPNYSSGKSVTIRFCNTSKRDVLIRWELPLILKVGSQDFTEDDLSAPLDSHESKKLADKLELAWLEEEKRNIPSLGRVLQSLFGTEFATYPIVFLPLRIGIM